MYIIILDAQTIFGKGSTSSKTLLCYNTIRPLPHYQSNDLASTFREKNNKASLRINSCTITVVSSKMNMIESLSLP